MQFLSRASSSLRSACSSSTGFISLRAFSEAAAQDAAANTEGAKSILHRLLDSAPKPLTSAEVWALAEQEGLKSKRFTKQMLQQMRRVGHVKTVPLGGGKKHKSFGYMLPQSAAAEAHASARAAPKGQ